LQIIKKQTIKGSIFSYIGAILALVNNGILFPRILSQDQIGILNWLIAISLIFSQASCLGFNNITDRLFPYFRSSSKYHNGYPSLMIFVGFIGIIVSSLVFYFTNERYSNDLTHEYIYYVFPLLFFGTYYNLFDAYNKTSYDAVSGTFFRDIVFKLLNMLALLLMYLGLINFSIFSKIYVAAFCLPAILLFFLLLYKNNIGFSRLNFKLFQSYKGQMFNLSVFGIFNSFSNSFAVQIDRIMIVGYLSYAENGIYATMANFGVLISMPLRSLTKISTTVISEAWKNKDKTMIMSIYKNSSINQFVVACFLYIGLISNTDFIFELVTDSYLPGHKVLIFIGAAHILHMLSGVNGVIIQTSEKYKYQSFFLAIFALLLIITNMIFIPLYGIVGAASASFISVFIYSLLKFIFVYKWFGMQPFSLKYIYVVIISFVLLYLSLTYIDLDNAYLNLLLRGFFITVLYFLFCYKLNISKDINQIVNKWLKKIKGKSI
jgi:O-antigen/teichoic acid export membrane protein